LFRTLIPFCIQDDTEEARRKRDLELLVMLLKPEEKRKLDLVHLVSHLKLETKRKRRRHTSDVCRGADDAADKGAA
jgi:hypothetical protein